MSYEVWGDTDQDEQFEAARQAGWIDPVDVSKAVIDVMNERDRQWNEEGFDPPHDDAHTNGELAAAAACYAITEPLNDDTALCRGALWPWDWGWWKPTDRRRDLVKAAALLIAEIERLDRRKDRDHG